MYNDQSIQRIREILTLPSQQAALRLDAMSREEQLDLILSVSEGRKRMDLILLAKHSRELMQAMSPEDMVMTIKDIGDEDAIALLELSSDEQLTYLLDLETWIQHGLDLQRLAHWLELLFECGPQRVNSWLVSVDFEQLVLLFERTLLWVQKDDIDTLPDMVSNRLITPDDSHFFVVKLGIEYSLIKRLIELMYAEQRELFYAMIANLGSTPPAEIEEQAYHWRLGRLADRGWPDFEESKTIYRGIDPGQVPSRSHQPLGLDNPPRYPIQAFGEGDVFRQAVSLLPAGQQQLLMSQFANLTNRVMIADKLVLTEKSSYTKAAKKIMGYLTIGHALLGIINHPEILAAALQQIPLLSVFQVAFGAVQKRSQQAKNLMASPGADWLALLGTPLGERVEALENPMTSFFSHTTGMYEDFSSMQQIETIDRDLTLISASLACLNALGLKKSNLLHPFPAGCHPESIEGLNVFMILATVFARGILDLDPILHALPIKYLPKLASDLPKDRNFLSGRINTWLANLTEHQPDGLNLLADKLSESFQEILHTTNPDRLDPRFMEGLWLQEHSNG